MRLIIRGSILFVLAFAVYDAFAETPLDDLNIGLQITLYIIDIILLLLASVHGNLVTIILVSVASLINALLLFFTLTGKAEDQNDPYNICSKIENSIARQECIDHLSPSQALYQ